LARIVKSAHGGMAATARSAVDDEGRLAQRVAALLEVHAMAIANVEHAAAIGLYGGVEAVLRHALIPAAAFPMAECEDA
jgi:phage gpG-like protein